MAKVKLKSKTNGHAGHAERVVIVGHGAYGLMYGRITATDAEIAAAGAVTVQRARQIAHWKGDPGGITSLAATGPKSGSRIGKECPASLVTEVKAVHVVSEAAIAVFDAMPASA